MRLRQLQVVHRHGDRTPLINVFQGCADARTETAESQLWERKLPPSTQLTQLRFKFDVHTDDDAQISFQQRPFGCLTTLGVKQMKMRGNWLQELCAKEELLLDDVTTEQVQIYSSAYARTQLSVQALLDGMLREHLHLSPQIGVLPPERDIMNTYQSFPEIMQVKLELEKDNAEFAAREHEMMPIKQELARLLPAVNSGQIPFSWLNAADYFVCRRVHQIPFIPGTEVHGEATERHLSYRFHQFYSHQTILKLVAGRLMHNVLREMQKIRCGHCEGNKIVIYSGHDVSLLSVLRTLNADTTDDMRFWPAYSSALVLKLLEDENGIFYVRAQLNGEPLAIIDGSDGLSSANRFRDQVTDRIGCRAK